MAVLEIGTDPQKREPNADVRMGVKLIPRADGGHDFPIGVVIGALKDGQVAEVQVQGEPVSEIVERQGDGYWRH